MKTLPLIPLSALVVTLVFSTAFAAPAETKEIGAFKDWTAFVDGQGDKQTCFIGSVPRKTEGNATQRGKTYALVTHRPKEKTFGEISVKAGYTYKEGSEASVDIDGKAFKLFTKGGNAWAYDANADKAVVETMKKGRQMTVTGTSSRGTSTTDTYSLAGFGAAYDAINKACGAK